MKVIVVDDETAFADEVAAVVREEGHEAAVYSTIESAWEDLHLEERLDLIVLLDHDFYGESKGYELCRRIRTSHPVGLLLPIVYLTGRETHEGYQRHWAEEPASSPSLYLDKATIARDDTILIDLLNRYAEQLDQVLELADIQSARRALLRMSELRDVATVLPEHGDDEPHWE